MTNQISTDYTRLYADLPVRSSQRDLRAAKRSAIQLFQAVKQEGFEWSKTALVDPDARFYITRELDRCVLKVYNTAVEKIQATEEHAANYQELVATPKNCGGFSLDTAILENATPFEQMVAFDQWIDRKAANWTKGRRTLCFREGDSDYVPIYIASRTNVRATTMTTILGSSRGQYKAPKYSDLSRDEELARTSVFRKPLESLEMVRQPHFSAATVLKGNAFETERIDHARRYEITDSENNMGKSQFACVELVGQKDESNSPIKEKSAANNLISLVKKCPEERVNIVLNFEELASAGYDDNTEVEITPKALWEATEKSICDADEAELVDLMTKLFVAKVQPFTSPIVGDFYANRIFGINNE